MDNRDTPVPIKDDQIGAIRDFYNNVYHAGADSAHEEYRGHYQRLFQRLKLSKDHRVLDVACGTGGWLRTCARQGCGVAGIDLSDRAIDICKSQLPGGDFYAQPAESLPWEDDRFDVVTCLGSLEHFVDPVASLREMCRVAKPDAVFVILVPNADFLTRRLGFFGGTRQVDAKEVVRSLDEWQRLFNEAGLTVTQRWRDLHVMHPDWIARGHPVAWPARLVQALLLPLWPLRWQYQVYHRCCTTSA